jgi:hypothetical protein
MAGFFDRCRQRKLIPSQAQVAQPLVDDFRSHVEVQSRAIRNQFGSLPGFPPTCSRCDRLMIYERVQLSRKKWRWMWRCPSCYQTVYDAAIRKAETAL